MVGWSLVVLGRAALFQAVVSCFFLFFLGGWAELHCRIGRSWIRGGVGGVVGFDLEGMNFGGWDLELRWTGLTDSPVGVLMMLVVRMGLWVV